MLLRLVCAGNGGRAPASRIIASIPSCRSRSRYPGFISLEAQFRALDAMRPASRRVSSSAGVGFTRAETHRSANVRLWRVGA